MTASPTFSQQALMALFQPASGGDGISPITGVLGPVGAVTQTSTPSMSVSIAARCWAIPGPALTSVGAYLWTPGTTAIAVAIGAADPTNPRIDLVTAQVITPGTSLTAGTADYVIVPGTPAASPVAPTLPSGALLIASVRVNAGVTSIVNANITDLSLPILPRYSITVPQGFILGQKSSSDTTGVTTTETNIQNLGSVAAVMPSGLGTRAMRVAIDFAVSSTVAGDEAKIQLYNGASVVLTHTVTLPSTSGRNACFTREVLLTGIAAGLSTLKATVLRSAGTGTLTVSHTVSNGITVWDDGDG